MDTSVIFLRGGGGKHNNCNSHVRFNLGVFSFFVFLLSTYLSKSPKWSFALCGGGRLMTAVHMTSLQNAVNAFLTNDDVGWDIPRGSTCLMFFYQESTKHDAREILRRKVQRDQKTESPQSCQCPLLIILMLWIFVQCIFWILALKLIRMSTLNYKTLGSVCLSVWNVSGTFRAWDISFM